jgi:hypothetical protein
MNPLLTWLVNGISFVLKLWLILGSIGFILSLAIISLKTNPEKPQEQPDLSPVRWTTVFWWVFNSIVFFPKALSHSFTQAQGARTDLKSEDSETKKPEPKQI